jgi:PKD repeat protein
VASYGTAVLGFGTIFAFYTLNIIIMCSKVRSFRPHQFFILILFSIFFHPVIGQSDIKLNCDLDFEKTANLSAVFDDYTVYSIEKSELYKRDNPLKDNELNFSFTNQNEQFEFLLEEVDMTQNANFYTLDRTGKNQYKISSNLKSFKGHFKDGRPGYIRLTIGDNNFMYGTIKSEKDEYFIEPVQYFEKGIENNSKIVVYNSKNLSNQHSNYHCHRQDEIESRIETKQNGSRSDGQCFKVSYSILADYSMVIDPAHPGVNNVISHIVAVMNNMQGLYAYDGNNNFTNGINFDINEIVVSTCSGCDPISSTKVASTVLNEFSQWVNSGGFNGSLQAAQFWTDRTFSNSIIGLATQSKNLFCESKAHSIIRDYTTTAALLRTLVAHEIAHNFNGAHDSASGQILSPTVTATSAWSLTSKATISSEISAQAACFKDCQTDLCEDISNLSISDISSSSFKISWNPLSAMHKYRIVVKKLNTDEVIFETISSNNTHTISPSGYTICEKYKVSVQSICSDNAVGAVNEIIFSSPTGQGCADFVSECKVSWPAGMVKFVDKSTNAVSWLWDFGNGMTSTAQHPQVSFPQPGVYDVSLTVNNGTHSCTKEELIYILPEISPESPISPNNMEYTDQFMPDIMEGSMNVWEYGQSDYNLKTNGNAWKTILNGNIPKGTYKSALYSPKFDLSKHAGYILNFDLGMQVEFCNAPVAAQLQFSVDNGISWQRLGTTNDLYNNASGQICQIASRIFTDRIGWAFTGNNVKMTHDLSFLVGQRSVVFRFVFAVDEIFLSGFNVDGLLVDNFSIAPYYSAPLGIDANSLTVKKQNNNTNLLEWRANQVSSIDRFEIYKSADGVDFNLLQSVLKIDNDNTEYSFVDENSTHLYTPYSFYQVISIDFDGKKSVSNIVKINNSKVDFKIFPNPVGTGGKLNIQYSADYHNIKYKILDIFSRIIIPEQILSSENEIDIHTLKPGAYMILLYEDAGFTTYEPFIVSE